MLQPLQVSRVPPTTVCHIYCLKAQTFDKHSVFSYHVCMLHVTTNSKTTFPRKSHVYWKSIHFHRITLIENIAIWENLCAGEIGVNQPVTCQPASQPALDWVYSFCWAGSSFQRFAVCICITDTHYTAFCKEISVVLSVGGTTSSTNY